MSAAPFFDRVLESTTTTGTGTLTLAGAVTGYQSFTAVGNGNTTAMAIWEVDANGNPSGAWEVANGCTYTASGTTLTRGTFVASSTGSAISFGAGTKRVAQTLNSSHFTIAAGTSGYVDLVGDGSTTVILGSFTATNFGGAVPTVLFNEKNWWDATNHKFLPLVPGKYLICAGVAISLISSNKELLLMLYLNGAEHKRLSRATVGTGQTLGVNGSAIVSLNGSSDYIEPFALQTDAPSLQTEAYGPSIFFNARYLGP